MKNYSEIEDITKEVFTDYQKVFELITEYEKERIEPEEVEELKSEIEELKELLKKCKDEFDYTYDYLVHNTTSEQWSSENGFKDICDLTKELKWWIDN